MCGILLLCGPDAAARIGDGLDRLRHRGPDDRALWTERDLALGFVRLAIEGDEIEGRQPFTHGDLVGAINGEIYNHRDLRRTLGLPPGACDTRVILPLLARRGPRLIDDLDGFYAGVVLRPSTREALCLRDHIGKKPLFVGRSRGAVFITSELKALPSIEWFSLLPRGAATVDLTTGRVTTIAAHQPSPPRGALAPLLREAVRKRVPTTQPVGVFLSGGLDSSIVAALTQRVRDDAIYFTLGDADGPDRMAAQTAASALDLRDVRAVALPSAAQLKALIPAVVFATESYNPSIISNGLATYLLARAAREAGVKVVLTGEGADELFGGYHSFTADDPWSEVRRQLVDDMHFTELRRLDMSAMAHGVEARCPFLDRRVRALSDQLPYAALYDGGENKVALRRGFAGLLPPAILQRRKTSFDVGSGLRGRVVEHLRSGGASERAALLDLWRQRFMFDASHPYFHAYPAFDAAIDRRGASHR